MARTGKSSLQQEIMAWLKANQYAYLATCDKKQPRVRPVVLFYVDDRFWVVTFSGESKVQQISSNGAIEVCLPLIEGGHTGYIRFSGYARIVSDNVQKRKATEFCYFFDEYFDGVDDPDFSLLELDLIEAEFLRPAETHGQSCTLRRY